MIEDKLTLPLIIGAAALDSINPCVFGVLIFLLAFLLTVFKSPRRMLIGGLASPRKVWLRGDIAGVRYQVTPGLVGNNAPGLGVTGNW